MSTQIGCFNWDRILPKWSSIAYKLASLHQEHNLKHLEYLKDEIELKEFQEEPTDEDVIDALTLIEEQENVEKAVDEQINKAVEVIEALTLIKVTDDGSDGGYDSNSMMTESLDSDFTSFTSSDDSLELDWPTEVKRKIYVKPLDDSLSMITMDDRSIQSENSFESAQPHFLDFLPLAFTAII